MAFRNEMLILLILVIYGLVRLHHLSLKLFPGDILKLRALDCIPYETHRGLVNRIGIADEIYEFRIRIHFQEFLHAAGMRWILAQELLLSAHGESQVDEFLLLSLEFLHLLRRAILHYQELAPELGRMLRITPEMIVGAGRHVGQCELLLLRLVRIQFQ